MPPAELALLVGGGLLAGIVNTLAGGGSLLTVPILILLGLPGTLANGTNRVGILVQSATATWRFRAEDVRAFGEAAPVLLPVVAGALTGALLVSRTDDAVFERIFGVVMLVVLIPVLRRSARGAGPAPTPWRPAVAAIVYFGVGLYGGSFQAGVGIFLLFALSRSGMDLVRANAIKMIVVTVLTLATVPVFIAAGQVAWVPAGALAVGFFAGAATGARLAVRGGERVIRPVVALAVLALAGRMLGLYG